ncbi:hypothetical protein GCM10009742_29380 [Kribbella karoonensis]|uniref:Uncharacterized protein n=2 Tax=Kribbella karoonensis TaxID=324851 RepID=A0ABN2DPP4_9ACTN
MESGYTDSELRRRLRTGQWSRLSRDVYVEAVLYGLPTWGLDLSKVHVTKASGRTRSDKIAELHRSRFESGDIAVVDGLHVVTPARAVVEAACTSSYEVGVVLGDAALREGLISPDLLVATADRHRT